MSNLRRSQLEALAAGVPQQIRDQIEAEAIAKQKVVKALPYFSTARLQATRTGVAPGPFTYTIAADERRLFQYGLGADCSVAGFAAGTIATGAETNLLKSGETLGNADVYIYGIAVELCSNSEAVLAAEVWRHFWLELGLNGSDSEKIGTLNMFPGAGGLHGSAPSRLLQPAQNQAGGNDGGIGPAFGVMSNGYPTAGNFYRLPQPFIWRAIGKGRDSNLSVILKAGRSVTAQSTDRAAVAGAAPGASGQIDAHTSPAGAAGTAGTFVDVRVRLVTVSVGDRSINQ